MNLTLERDVAAEATDRPARAGRSTRLRLDDLDWDRVAADLDAQGVALLPRRLSAGVCEACIAQLEQPPDPVPQPMARAWAGPTWVELQLALAEALYPALVPIAHRWETALDRPHRAPATLAGLHARCRAAGQRHPWSRHRRLACGADEALGLDLAGDGDFPLQATVLLSRPGRDHTGGELVFTEQRPRLQSRVIALALAEGDIALMAAGHRPVHGAHGLYQVTLRHGVSRVRSGVRQALDLVFSLGMAPAPPEDAP